MSKFYTSVIQWGNNILYRGYEDGVRFHEKVPFSPTLFIDSKQETGYKTLWGQHVLPKSFDTMKDAKDFVKRYDDVEGFNLYGMTNFQYQFISDEYPGDIEFNVAEMVIKAFDIETASEGGFPNVETADEEVLLISIQDKTTKELVVFGSRPYTRQDGDDFEFIMCKDERDLLRRFIQYWRNNYPDIITGWNIDGFDIPYLINRIMKILGETEAKLLSPWGNLSSREIMNDFGKKATVWDIQGVVILDFLDLYKKFSYNQRESYTLGAIAEVELNEAKLEFEGSFKDAYTNQWTTFVQYNAHDTRLVLKLEDKLKFLELACTIAFLAKCNIRDVFGPVKTWDVFIFNYLKKKDIVIPQHKPVSTTGIEGAFVKEPKPGMYGWNISFDFASLYPTIIRQWNMSPETLVNDYSCRDMRPEDVVDATPKALEYFAYAKGKNYTIAANGTLYTKTKMGIIPEVVKVVVEGRKIAKKEQLQIEQEYQKTKNEKLKGKIASLKGKQLAFKVLANALYGALGNAGFRYTNKNIAEAITLTGQAANKSSSKHFNMYLNKLFKTENHDYIIYGDTDSIYVDVSKLVNKLWKDNPEKEVVEFLDAAGKKLQEGPANDSNQEMFEQCNCFEFLMDLKREAISSKGIWTAKKRYVLKVHNSEGVDYDPYEMKVTGLDMIKVSIPKPIREKLKEALKLVLEKDEEAVQAFISKFKSEYMKMPIEDIAFPRTANDIDKWIDPVTKYKPRTPIHVRASIMYNLLNKDGVYPNIKNGDKIKFIYLKMPNKTREDVIGFFSHSKLPHEFGLDNLVDRDLQWEKSFINPLESILGKIGWHAEKQASLEGVLF